MFLYLAPGVYFFNRNTFLIPLSPTQILRLDYEICIQNNDYSLFEQIIATPPCNLVPRPSLVPSPTPSPLPPQGCVRLVPISRKLKVKPPNYLPSCFERIRIASLLLHIFGSSENKHCRFWWRLKLRSVSKDTTVEITIKFIAKPSQEAVKGKSRNMSHVSVTWLQQKCPRSVWCLRNQPR